MTLPPYELNAEEVRPHFRGLLQWRDELRSKYFDEQFQHLSMGMTHDFEVAIEEGATMIRLGTGLFGNRPKK